MSAEDTKRFRMLLTPVELLSPDRLAMLDPLHPPERGNVLAIWTTLREAPSPPRYTHRKRRAPKSEVVAQPFSGGSVTCSGFLGYADHGQFPDIPCQALEVKAQWRRTIDLGLVTPDSTEEARGLAGLRHCDVRDRVTELEPRDSEFEITEVVVSTGEAFFSEFRAFEGLKENRKLQMHLPPDFFAQSEPLPD